MGAELPAAAAHSSAFVAGRVGGLVAACGHGAERGCEEREKWRGCRWMRARAGAFALPGRSDALCIPCAHLCVTWTSVSLCVVPHTLDRGGAQEMAVNRGVVRSGRHRLCPGITRHS